jgi:hypothetical protein
MNKIVIILNKLRFGGTSISGLFRDKEKQVILTDEIGEIMATLLAIQSRTKQDQGLAQLIY